MIGCPGWLLVESGARLAGLIVESSARLERLHTTH